MTRIRFALIALVLSLAALPALAQENGTPPESASDATTPMDRKVGNLDPPTDNTLSNTEVKQLQSGQNPGAAGSEIVPSVSGTTPSYKEKGGSAQKTEGVDGQ